MFMLTGALATTFAPTPVAAQEGQVIMEIGTEDGFNQLEIREWYELLTGFKVTNLRISGARPGDKIEILSEGTERSPIYRVKGLLTGNGQLIVPGGRFTKRNPQALAKWVADLRKHGPGGPKVDTTGATFGLDDTQLKTIQRDLAKTVDFSTVGMSRTEILDKLDERLEYSINISGASRRAMEAAGDATFELKDMACGTALAYVIRAAGLGMAPQEALDAFEYRIVAADSLKQSWPVGLESDKRLRDLIPNAFELVNFQVNPQTPLTSALPPIAEYLNTSFLFDENLMAAAELDPTQSLVEMSPKRTALSMAADRLLTQARMRSKVRIDEAGRPFYWVTPLIVPRK